MISLFRLAEPKPRAIAGLKPLAFDRLMTKTVVESVRRRGFVSQEDFVLAGVPAFELTDARMAEAVRRARAAEPNLDAMREIA